MAIFGGIIVADNQMGHVRGEVVLVDTAQLGDFVVDVGLERKDGSQQVPVMAACTWAGRERGRTRWSGGMLVQQTMMPLNGADGSIENRSSSPDDGEAMFALQTRAGADSGVL